MATLDPPDTPLTAGDVAEMVGLSSEDAVLALRELRSLGYAEEENRGYLATEEGRRVHESLAQARRDALVAFLNGLTVNERQELAAAIRGQTQ
jgi:Mn-dependent DtxR family transcriptional regulator